VHPVLRERCTRNTKHGRRSDDHRTAEGRASSASRHTLDSNRHPQALTSLFGEPRPSPTLSESAAATFSCSHRLHPPPPKNTHTHTHTHTSTRQTCTMCCDRRTCTVPAGWFTSHDAACPLAPGRLVPLTQHSAAYTKPLAHTHAPSQSARVLLQHGCQPAQCVGVAVRGLGWCA
jgi:hypothetical protein